METIAVVLEAPERLTVDRVMLAEPGEHDLVVDVEWSGISTGTERLLYSGRMPPFPGMGYPLVPGYESVGRVAAAGLKTDARLGERVFVPGARCFGDIKGLFGGAAARLVVPADRVIALPCGVAEEGTLMALAATAHHAVSAARLLPDLVVGHGALGRLIARMTVLSGGDPPVVWERDPVRAQGGDGYDVRSPDDDSRQDYRSIVDVSGDSAILDTLLSRLSPGGEIVLAGFYAEPLSFSFPAAFLREARIRVSAEWRREDLEAVAGHVAAGRLSLDGLITHRSSIGSAADAYRTAFAEPACLKMILDWRDAR